MERDNPLQRIQEKLQQLVKQQARLRQENTELQESLARANEERATLATQVQELRQALSLAKLASGNFNAQEKKEFEKQLNRFVRELDKAIAYLST